MENLNLNGRLTWKERVNLSFPDQFLYNQNLLVGDVLDFGFGSDVKLFQEKGVKIED
jgi:hypothetical protein